MSDARRAAPGAPSEGTAPSPPVIRVLGIDPGSRVTGYGFVELQGQSRRLVAAGCIRTGNGDMPARLGVIFEQVRDLVRTHRPAAMAIEDVFVSRGVDAALKLGQARAAAILAAFTENIPVSEYAARRVKKAVTGSGSATKDQVQRMVALTLGASQPLQADAADALAIAICHLSIQNSPVRWPSRRRGRWTTLP